MNLAKVRIQANFHGIMDSLNCHAALSYVPVFSNNKEALYLPHHQGKIKAVDFKNQNCINNVFKAKIVP